jgi:DNA-binding response OmpR family regulator
VLIADDDPLILRLLQITLGQAGHDVSTATDGREALEMITEALPDLVVLDGMMPELDGLEVLRLLKADPATAALPVVLMTARSEEDDVTTGRNLGAAEYLVKPFPPADLLAIVDRLSG